MFAAHLSFAVLTVTFCIVCKTWTVEPVIMSSPSNVTTLIDHVPVSMQCAVDGEPFPVVTWQQRSSSLETWRSVRSHLTGRYRLSKSGQRLEFRKLLMSDVGFYRCVARNLLGQVFSDPAFLDVHGVLIAVDYQYIF
jgi:Immunoglobulin domain